MTVFGLIIFPLSPTTKLHFSVSEARESVSKTWGNFIEEVVQCVRLVAELSISRLAIVYVVI